MNKDAAMVASILKNDILSLDFDISPMTHEDVLSIATIWDDVGGPAMDRMREMEVGEYCVWGSVNNMVGGLVRDLNRFYVVTETHVDTHDTNKDSKMLLMLKPVWRMNMEANIIAAILKGDIPRLSYIYSRQWYVEDDMYLIFEIPFKYIDFIPEKGDIINLIDTGDKTLLLDVEKIDNYYRIKVLNKINASLDEQLSHLSLEEHE